MYKRQSQRRVHGDISAGRFVNPGHDIECSWFLMEQAKYTNDEELRRKAMEVFDMAIALSLIHI